MDDLFSLEGKNAWSWGPAAWVRPSPAASLRYGARLELAERNAAALERCAAALAEAGSAPVRTPRSGRHRRGRHAGARGDDGRRAWAGWTSSSTPSATTSRHTRPSSPWTSGTGSSASTCRAVMLACKLFGAHMIEQGGGKIINLSSVRDDRGALGGNAGYCATKGAVKMITKQLGVELAPYRVYVNALGPIITVTPMTAERIRQDASRYERMLLNVPMGRMADVADLVGPAVFLASAASDFITGTVLYVDGGMMATPEARWCDRRRHRLRRPHGAGPHRRLAQGRPAGGARPLVDPGGGGARRRGAGRGGRGRHRPDQAERRRRQPGAGGGAQGRLPRGGAGLHRHAPVRLRAAGGGQRRPGDPLRRRRDRRRRRRREHEPCARTTCAAPASASSRATAWSSTRTPRASRARSPRRSTATSPWGCTAENLAEQYGIPREAQDEYALRSQERAFAAIENGRFEDEIVPVEVPARKGPPVVFDTDEYPRQTSLRAARRPRSRSSRRAAASRPATRRAATTAPPVSY